jgi:hypothetical protein
MDRLVVVVVDIYMGWVATRRQYICFRRRPQQQAGSLPPNDNAARHEHDDDDDDDDADDNARCTVHRGQYSLSPVTPDSLMLNDREITIQSQTASSLLIIFTRHHKANSPSPHLTWP